jgi:uncharacterized protein with FMN-binding domain
MRKLVLSLCVVAASGADVAGTAMTKDGGVQDLLDRVSFHPSRPALDLDLSTTPPPLDDLLVPPVAPSDPPLAPENAIAAPAEAPSVLSLLPPITAPAPAPVPPSEPAPAAAPAIVPPLPRLAPRPPVAALAPPPAVGAPTPAPAQPPAPVTPPAGKFHDGAYTGAAADAYFGMVQVRAHVVGGKLTSVEVLTYPTSRRTSRRINDYALPILEREVVSVQDAAVDIVSGATLTAAAYIRSLKSALGQAM